MNSGTNSITIVGGGLAGLTLGIGLRQRGVPAVIWEAGTYPRHRVCGEFISGAGLETMNRLGLRDALRQTEMHTARTAVFFAGRRQSPIRTLPKPALCVSRHELDARLAECFRGLGGKLRCGLRWEGSGTDEGIVYASGRRVQTDEQGWRWYGLKAHAHNLELAADLEMHFAGNGYVGLCRLPGNTVNVCGLFRRQRNEPGLPANLAERFCSESDGFLTERLRGATWDSTSFCAVGGLSYQARPCDGIAQCAIGDAFDLIPPVTGNGMSMAFESAELALEPLVDFGRGRVDWATASGRVRENCHLAFARRLGTARRLHHALFSAPVRKFLLPFVARSEFLWRLFFRATR